MATKVKSSGRKSRRYLDVAKPSGSLHPRVQKVGPEHFGIVAVDCAKARSKWMLADFYGRILNGLTILFPQVSQIAFGLYMGLMLWGGPWLHGRSFRIPFSC